MLYLFVLLLLIVFSIRYDIQEKEYGRSFCYLTVLFILIMIAGLRWRLGVDTPNSLARFYNWIPYIWDITFEDLSIGKKPLWLLLNSVVYTISGRFFVLQFLQSAFVNFLVFRYIKKHSNHWFTCFLFYYMFLYVAFNMETMKAGCAIVVCLYANDYLLERKWFKSYILYIVAVLFHPQALVLFLTPLFLWLKLNRKGLIFLFFAFIAGYLIQVSIGDYIELIQEFGDESIGEKAETYSESDEYISQTGSVLKIMIQMLPIIIYSLFCLYYTLRKGLNLRIQSLQPFVMFGIACFVIRLNVEIFYRIGYHFAIYFVLIYAEVFVHMVNSVKKNSFNYAFVRTVLFFSPLILSLTSGYLTKSYRYYPYSSVIERKVDKEREARYQNALRPSANTDQY